MPLFLHGADIIWVNSYVLYKETSYRYPDVNDDEINSHKQFLIEFINSLTSRAIDEITPNPATQ